MDQLPDIILAWAVQPVRDEEGSWGILPSQTVYTQMCRWVTQILSRAAAWLHHRAVALDSGVHMLAHIALTHELAFTTEDGQSGEGEASPQG